MPSRDRLPVLGIIGNPENRRVQDFSLACQQSGWPMPVVVSYERLLAGEAERLLRDWPVDLVRLDSPGENEAVASALIALGGGPPDPEVAFGEVAYLGEYHRGFRRLLQAVERCQLLCLNAPSEIAVMFDKWACHQRFVENDLARPASWLAPTTFEELWAIKEETTSGRLFLKPLHGSSASGVCALRWAPGRLQMMTPLVMEADGLFNCLQVQTYSERAPIEFILRRLLPQGMIAERWIPKLALSGGVVDLRVLVIDGVARHRVVRQSLGPMTNLHLGNRRGDEDELRQALGDRSWQAALSLAESAARCFPESLYAGVDILLDSAGRAFVGEVNAFGDLLPNLEHGGESAYSAIANAAAASFRKARASQ